MITDIEDYFSKGCGRCKRFDTPDCSARQWAGGLHHLRLICRDEDLDETVKWGHPCYMHADRNIALIGAFRGDFRLNFFNAALMKDPENILEKRGPNTQSKDMIRFTDNTQVKEREAVIRAYLNEAKQYAAKNIKPPKNNTAITLPEELVEALEFDPELAAAFNRLTPGRQKSYVIHINAAKKSETRVARIQKFRAKIMQGKGALER